jgi:hypothetical protein
MEQRHSSCFFYFLSKIKAKKQHPQEASLGLSKVPHGHNDTKNSLLQKRGEARLADYRYLIQARFYYS